MAAHRTGQSAAISSPSVDMLATQFMSKVFLRKEEPRRSKRRKLPWESWELDQEFLSALSQWTLTHPETTLDWVLKNISDGLENHRDLLALIPDSPFPARGLVTALGYLFKLGVTISRAKAEVHNFAKDVVRWVGAVKSVFESQCDGRFTRLAWRDLRHMRDLINEVCTWAVERIDDGRWSRIGNGLKIQGEIEEFNRRMTDAQSLFQDLSAINLAKGIDAILAHLRKLVQGQRVIIYEIKKIRQAQDKQFAEIINELKTQQLAAEREHFLSAALAGHVVADATYDKQGKRPCDPETRVEVLGEIDKWINDLSSGSRNFLWLTGDPGCGKSAVTASVSRECKKRNILWAQFFINRNNAETTDPNSYFPSIARQLARHSTAVAVALHDALRGDRTLTDGISADQATKLFIDAVRCASQLDPKKSVVVVIDGLDETDRKRLRDTAEIFATLFTALAAYSNVKIVISSRTENEISTSFILPSQDKHVKRVHLDTAHPSSIRDVSHYIKQRLLQLVRVHDLNWVIWPGDRRSQVLGERASGLFIWAVTAIKFIQEQLEFDGTECLDDVLDMLTADVLHDVNALYMLILKVTYRNRATQWDLERFRRIVGAIVFLQEPLRIDDLATLLDLRQGPSSNPVDILQFVRRLRTILVTGTDIIDETTVPRIHKSVFEFITSDSVDPQFRVNPEHTHLELGIQCLSQLGQSHMSVTKDTLSAPFRYASRFWSSHLSQANVMKPRIVSIDCRRHPLPSLPSFDLTRIVSMEQPITLRYLSTEAKIQTTQGDHVLPWDASTGVNLLDHTGYVTCLAFSPDGRQVMSSSVDKTIRVMDSTNGQRISTLVKYPSPIRAIAFSPNGESIVSGSEDGVLCLWNPSTGALIGQPFSGHKGRVQCVAFSPDGQHIISGSNDETCILWDAHTGQQVGEPWTGHQSFVRSIAFSASGRRACSGDDAGYCFIWDASTGNKIGSWRYDRWAANSISFSPQNDDVMAVANMDGIEIRSNDGQWTLSNSKAARCLSFSADGKRIIFATGDAVIVADIGRGQDLNCVIKRGEIVRGYGPKSFSPDLRYLAYALDNAVHVRAVQHNKRSLDIVPVTRSLPEMTTNDTKDEFIDILYDLREVYNNSPVNNRRLNAIKWYEPKAETSNNSFSKILMVTDEVLIVASSDGLVSVWNRHISKSI